MKYLKNLTNHNAYSAFIVGSDFNSIQTEHNASVSYCKNERHIHYNPYVPKAKLLDILYSDANGNLSFTSEVLPVSEGKTPIGLCIAATNFFGTGEKARWMSLKYMNYTTPDTGSLTQQDIYWGNYGTDIPTINNITTTHKGGSISGCFTNWGDDSISVIPALFNVNNEWNISILGTVNQYTMTDIDGKNKTDLILATAIGQSTWQTDTSINNQYETNYAPVACCCWRYHTLGTQQGDWYLGGCGEIGIIIPKRININNKLTAINAVYPNDCINSLINRVYWTSTEYSNNSTYIVSINDDSIYTSGKNDGKYTFALLQY